MATYNGEKYLREQLDSIVNQTYPNIEIVVCDDRSTDATPQILEEYAKKFNLRYEINKANLWFKKNFEKAISLCNGEYIALSDQDDVWVEEKIDILVENIGENILIYCDAMIVDENLKSLNQFIVKPNNFYAGSNPLPFILFNYAYGNSMLFSNKLVEKIIPIAEDFYYHDWWISFNAAVVGSVTYVDKNLLLYRRHESQITVAKNKKRYSSIADRLETKSNNLQNMIAILSKEYETYLSRNDLDTTTKIILKMLKKHYSNFNVYFNFQLFRVLFKNRDLIFNNLEREKRIKRTIVHSMGMKFHKLTLLSLGIKT